MKKEYKLSIITPVYNAQKYLQRSFASVQVQTLGFDEIQLIYCDDCSTDGSWQTLQRMQAEYENITLLRTEKNSGFAAVPRNKALEYVAAPYVMFLDADDELLPDACETLLTAIQQHDVDLVSGAYSIYDAQGKCLERFTEAYLAAQEGKYTFENGLLVFEPLVILFACKIYKADLIREHTIRFGDAAGEDTWFVVQYLLCSKSAYYIRKPVFRYYMYGSSISHDRTLRYFTMVGDFYLSLKELLGEKNEPFFRKHVNVDYFLNEFLVSSAVSAKDVQPLMEQWWPLLQYAADNALPAQAPAVKMLLHMAAEDRRKDAVFCAQQILKLEEQRRQELQNIFSSTSWKLGSKIVSLFRRK